jgi:hypothetical protein
VAISYATSPFLIIIFGIRDCFTSFAMTIVNFGLCFKYFHELLSEE